MPQRTPPYGTNRTSDLCVRGGGEALQRVPGTANSRGAPELPAEGGPFGRKVGPRRQLYNGCGYAGV
eukprot:6471451-Pyramimonas_sp.AAC.1